MSVLTHGVEKHHHVPSPSGRLSRFIVCGACRIDDATDELCTVVHNESLNIQHVVFFIARDSVQQDP